MKMINKHAAAVTVILSVLTFTMFGYAQEKSNYSDIPRIDVHTHIGGNADGVANFLEMRKILQRDYHADLAMWIDLGSSENPIPDLEKSLEVSKGRVLTCISDYSAHDGLDNPPKDLHKWLEKGYAGYKIWAGPYYRKLKEGQEGFRYIDNLVHEPTFAEMERIGMVAASIHIADPNGPYGNRSKWLADPVEYWREITAWRRVLERHPDLVAVTAHGDWLVCQDAQLDYLRNMLATFPNLNIDLAATFQYYHLVDRENLRAFMIEWADRILYATDIGSFENPEEAKARSEQYNRTFRILETDEMVEGGFFGMNETRGLALPLEVLEKIYYKNAARIYPHLSEQLKELGYNIQ
ncbi:MAG: amidohydrolase [Candidatus Marinimicrobia bacterium]|nr:amidohydrolase [Candidatus Neomarinimicrobiota bacterium]MCF7830198.1 amidohydrolase [Candidatus Neomarinimicrobiota bacterium]MCF7880815.1 amidohydrolase [Candidatus Neomarinimicrobiota bacterium]